MSAFFPVEPTRTGGGKYARPCFPFASATISGRVQQTVVWWWLFLLLPFQNGDRYVTQRRQQPDTEVGPVQIDNAKFDVHGASLIIIIDQHTTINMSISLLCR
jgi:hypothetical protein